MGCGASSGVNKLEARVSPENRKKAALLSNKKEELAVWRSHGGGDLELVLASNAIALIDARWIVKHAEAGGVLKHRQALPKEAFLSLTDLIEAGYPNGGLPILVLSHPWLTKHHPDPDGDNLRQVARALKALLNDYKVKRYGVFWDYLSLHQHPDPTKGVMRTKAENALFKQGLGCLGTLYSHQRTTMLRLTTFPRTYKKKDQPEGANVSDYFDRGWCFSESAWSSLTKGCANSLDIGRMREGKEYDRPYALIAECATGGSGRRPPLLAPSQFAAELETKSFTNGKQDRPLLIAQYEAVFNEQFGKATWLKYRGLCWGDAEAAQLAEVISSGAAPQLESLYMHYNSIGDEGCKALAAAIGKGGCAPRLKLLDLQRNQIGDEGLRALAAALGEEGAAPRLKTISVDRKPAELEAVCEARGIELRIKGLSFG